MAKYRKKPVMIDAVQFTREMAEGSEPLPDGVQFRRRELNSKRRFHDFQAETNFRFCHRHVIDTLEGEMGVQVGDYVIRGVAGEFYPCNLDIFAATYEAVEDPTREPLAAASEPVLVLDAARFALVSREVLAHMSIEGVDITEEAIAIALGKGYEKPTDDDYTQAVRVAVDELRLRLESPSVTEVPRG